MHGCPVSAEQMAFVAGSSRSLKIRRAHPTTQRCSALAVFPRRSIVQLAVGASGQWGRDLVGCEREFTCDPPYLTVGGGADNAAVRLPK